MLVVVVASTVGVSQSTSSASPVRVIVHGAITANFTEILKTGVVDGGVSGQGRFTMSGVIADRGTVTEYRGVAAGLEWIRFVAVGMRGTIGFAIVYQLGTHVP